jgi:hypothetical protein
MALVSQPVRMNSVASQSSSSMGRPLPCEPKFDRLDDACAEVHLPEAVHRNARQQRVFGLTSHRESQAIARRARG